MPRNAAGIYSLPTPPVVTDTTIESLDENTTRGDIAAELTNSLDRNGRGGMLAPFRIADGTAPAPGLSFLNDPNCGLWREGADLWHAVVGGLNVLSFSAAGLVVAGTLSVASRVASPVFKVPGPVSLVAPLAGEAYLHTTAVNGLSVYGNGTTSDFTLFNKNLQGVMNVATGTVNVNFAGTINALGPVLAVGSAGNPATIWMNRAGDGVVSHSLSVTGGFLNINDAVAGNGVQITWNGNVRISVASVVVLTGNAPGAAMATISHTAANPYGYYLAFTGAAPNNGTNWFIWASDTVQARFVVYSNGGITNFSAFNAALSDARWKTFSGKPIDSQRAKLRKLDIVMGRYADSNEPGEFPMLTAQQVQSVYPELVTMIDGKDKLGIYEQRLWMRHLKVTQEHDDIIESLTARVSAIERRPDAPQL